MWPFKQKITEEQARIKATIEAVIREGSGASVDSIVSEVDLIRFAIDYLEQHGKKVRKEIKWNDYVVRTIGLSYNQKSQLLKEVESKMGMTVCDGLHTRKDFTLDLLVLDYGHKLTNNRNAQQKSSGFA